MAPRKSASKNKKRTRVAAPIKETAPEQPAPVSKNNVIIRILIVAVLVVCVVESLNLFKGTEAPKPFKVQTFLTVSANTDACGPFNAWGIAPVGKDKIMVVDQGSSRILVFDRQGNCLKSWGKVGNGPKEFHEASGMTWDDRGNAYVMDTWNTAVKGFDENGKEVLDKTLDTGNFYGPRGIAYDGHNFIVADTGGQRVAFVSMDGKVAGTWGTMGSDPGKFKGPLDVATDGKGNYFVADTENSRVQWMDQDGKVVKVIKLKNPNGKPPSLAVDKNGHLFVSTANGTGNSCIKVFSTKDGGYLGDVMDEKDNQVTGARGMNVSPDGLLMLADGGMISLYQTQRLLLDAPRKNLIPRVDYQLGTI